MPEGLMARAAHDAGSQAAQSGACRGGLREDAAYADEVLRVVRRRTAEIGQSVVAGPVPAIVGAEQGKERGVAVDGDQASVSGEIVGGIDDGGVEKD
jgi:hypothetical protein